MKNGLHFLYQSTWAKYFKFRARYDKNLKNGNFKTLSLRKKHQIIAKLKRLYNRLLQLKWQLKLGAAAGMISISLLTSKPVNAQELGPFVQNDLKNTFKVGVKVNNNNDQIALGDLDGDGDLDVVLGNNYGQLRFFENIGTASAPAFENKTGTDNPFNNIYVSYYPSPALADLDNDGDLDFILGGNNNNLAFFENTGDASTPYFSPNPTPSPNPVDDIINAKYTYLRPTFTDIDNDGDLDVFAGQNYNSSTYPLITFWENDGTNNFTQVTGNLNPIFNVLEPLKSSISRAYPVFTDIDNDGDDDAFIGDAAGNIRFFRNEGTATTPSFPAEITGTSNPLDGINTTSNASPEFADLDNDGDVDLILGSGPYDAVRYFQNIGTASSPVFEEKFLNENPLTGFSLGDNIAPTVADVDGDGFQDLVIGSDNDNEIYYFKNNQDGTFKNQNGGDNFFAGLLGTSIYSPRPALSDIDGDGDLDLFAAVYSDVGPRKAYVMFFRNDDTNNFIQETSPISTNYYYTKFHLAMGDFDGDGDSEAIIGTNRANDLDASFIFLQNDGTFDAAATPPRTPDFIELDVYNPPFSGAHLLPLDNNYAIPVMVDLDHDGDIDVVSGNHNFFTSSGTITFFENVNNNLTEQTGANNPFNTIDVGYDSSPAFLDVDNDGDLDLLIGNKYGELIYFENQNLPPQVNITPLTGQFTEGDGAVTLAPNLTLTDDTSDNILGASIQIQNFVSGEDELSFITQFGISGSFDTITGELKLSGYATLAEYQTVLRSVTYNNTSISPDITARNIQFSVTDFDNTDPFSDTFTEPVIVVNISSVNSLPEVTVSVGNSTFTENDPATAIDAGITVNDVDNTTFESAVIQISGNYNQTEDALLFTNQNGISGSFDNTTGVLNLSGIATVANYQTALQSVQYVNNSENPSELTRSIEYSVFDGTDNSIVSTRDINVTAVNDLPSIIISNGSLSFTENDPATAIDAGITVNDVDNTTFESAIIQISGNFNQAEDALLFTNQNGISGSFDNATGVLNLSGIASVANYQTALQSVQYVNNSENPSELTRSIEYSVFDGTDNSIVSTRDINVTAVNDLPQLLSDNSGNNLVYTQNENGILIDDLINITDLDNTNLVSATVTINGFQTGDNLQFTNQNGITGIFSNGTLTLSGISSVSNYIIALQSVGFTSTNGAGTRSIEITVNDGTDLSSVYSRGIDIEAAITQPPVVITTPTTTQVGSIVIIDLCSIISDPDNNYDELIIEVVSILSDAVTTITNCELRIDYSGLGFSGTDSIILRATDPDGNSDQNTVSIDVEPSENLPLKVYNAVSPNGDGSNDWWEIENLTTPNKIELFNRWGDLVKTLNDYDNIADNTALNDLTGGTYFYKIQSPQGEYTGYLIIKN